MINELKLLSGSPIYIEGIGDIHPLKLKDIADMGMEHYNLFLLATTFDTKNVRLNDWFEASNMSEEIKQLMGWSLSLVFKDEVFFYGDCFQTKQGGILNKDNYSNFVSVIKAQYCLGNMQESGEEVYADEKAKQIGEKLTKYREQCRPKSNEDTTTLKDMISAIAARHPSINLFNIWDLTVYQMYDQLSRLNLVDNYNNTMFLLPYSEDAGKNIKHWSSKINNN